MNHNIDAAKFAGNNGVSVESDYGLWGTTTRKMKFRLSSANGRMVDRDQNSVEMQFDFTNMPAVKRATLVPESFRLSLNADTLTSPANVATGAMVPNDSAGNPYWGMTTGLVAVIPYSSVCLRCTQLSQPNSWDNGAHGAWSVPLANNDFQHGGFQGNSNIVMDMPIMNGDAPSDATDRTHQVHRNYSGNEYDCGSEIHNNCFQQNTWRFDLTNEYGQYYELGRNDVPGSFQMSWYAEFSIVYEEEKTDHQIN